MSFRDDMVAATMAEQAARLRALEIHGALIDRLDALREAADQAGFNPHLQVIFGRSFDLNYQRPPLLIMHVSIDNRFYPEGLAALGSLVVGRGFEWRLIPEGVAIGLVDGDGIEGCRVEITPHTNHHLGWCPSLTEATELAEVAA